MARPGSDTRPLTASCCSNATCSTSRSSTSTGGRSSASTTSSSTPRPSTPTSCSASSRSTWAPAARSGGSRRASCPSFTLRTLLDRIPPRVIPWLYVDLLETDPARRVKLKIVYEGLSKLHPADIANIVEDLRRAEREAVFETLDEEVAAEALEELDPESPGLDRRVARQSTAQPTSSRRWTRTRRPTCSASCRKTGRAKSSRRCSRRSARRSRNSSSSASTPPPAA